MNGLSKDQFERVFREGLRASGAHVRLHALPGPGRIGIATSRDLGSKPRRNTQKRRVREALRRIEDKRFAEFDRIVLVRASGAQADFEPLVEELRKLHEEVWRRWAEGLESR